jgi:hypothetical protein
MGWLILKTYLTWREPNSVRRKRESLADESSRKRRPLFVLIVAAGWLSLWFTATLVPNRNPQSFWSVLPLALGGGVVVVYVFPMLYKILPSYIKITEKGIEQLVGDDACFWKYEDIEFCRLMKNEEEAGVSGMLEIVTFKGNSLMLGIPVTVLLEEVQSILVEQGVQIVQDPADASPCAGGDTM